MNPLSPISEVSLRMEAGPSSSERPPFLPIEILGKIFSWLTPRKRHTLYQHLAEKQITLRSQIRQDLYATITLKKAVELADQEAWKPFQGFIDELVNIITKIQGTPLKEELSSLLTNLTELNENNACFEENEADFFVALFNLTPPAFNYLYAHFGKEDPFMKEVAIYRRFQRCNTFFHRVHGGHPQFETREKKFTDWVQSDHFLPAHKIFPLLGLISFTCQEHFAANIIYACYSTTITTKIQLEELIFFSKKFAELPYYNGDPANNCLLFSARALLEGGWLKEAKELFPPNPPPTDPDYPILPFDCTLFKAAAITVKSYEKKIEEELTKQVIEHEKIFAIEEKIFAIIELLMHEDLEVLTVIHSLSDIHNIRGQKIVSDQLKSRIFKLLHAVHPITKPHPFKRRLRFNCTIL